MKVLIISDDCIIFDNGTKITFDHEQDCCENNYADFNCLLEDDLIYEINFENLHFEFCDGFGFRFCNEFLCNGKMLLSEYYFCVPCYSDQNGYYTTEIDIYYNNEKVLSGQCCPRIYY